MGDSKTSFITPSPKKVIRLNENHYRNTYIHSDTLWCLWCYAKPPFPRPPAYLGLCGGTVLISTAHKDAVVAPGPAVAAVAVRAEHAADDVAQVGHIVHVRQRGGDEDVALPMHRQLGHRCLLSTGRHSLEDLHQPCLHSRQKKRS